MSKIIYEDATPNPEFLIKSIGVHPNLAYSKAEIMVKL